MPLVIVDDRLVIELSRADSEPVIGIGRRQQKAVVFQESPDQLVVLSGCFSERGELWIGIETRCQLGQRSLAD
jgi:hypothetical protein